MRWQKKVQKENTFFFPSQLQQLNTLMYPTGGINVYEPKICLLVLGTQCTWLELEETQGIYMQLLFTSYGISSVQTSRIHPTGKELPHRTLISVAFFTHKHLYKQHETRHVQKSLGTAEHTVCTYTKAQSQQKKKKEKKKEKRSGKTRIFAVYTTVSRLQKHESAGTTSKLSVLSDPRRACIHKLRLSGKLS